MLATFCLATPALAATCAGDCDESGATTQAELAIAVEVALLRAPIATCAAANLDQPPEVTVEEIVRAANPVTNPCRSGAPSPSPSPAPTPSATPGELTLAQKAVGPAQGSAALLLSLPRAFALIAARLGPAGHGAAAECPGGGSFTVDCARETPTSPAVYHIFATDCGVTSPGQSLRLGGTMRFTALGDAACFDGGAASFDMLVSFLRFDIEGESGILVTSGEDVGGTLGVGESVDGCATDHLDLSISGEATLDARSAPRHALNGAQFRFDALQLHTSIETQDPSCALTQFTTTVDGGLALRTGGSVFAAFYQSLRLASAIGDGENLVTASGSFVSDCFSSTVELATVEAAHLREGDACFRAGQLDLLHDGGGDRIRYTAIGGVDIDLDRDGALDQRFPTCVAPDLYVCPGG